MKNIILIGLILLFVTAPVTAEIRLVPGEYATIQAAIDAAFEDDEIIVSIGTYYENINFGGKNIILRSTEPMNPTVVASTIIDGRLGDSIIGGYRAGSVVTFSGAESPECILSGFTITNGSGTGSMGDMRGGGIYGKGTHATIQHNIISGNHAFPYVYPGSGYGGGLYSCNGLIRNNIIWGNRTTCSEGSATGGGLYGCNGIIQNNIIANNSASGFSGGWGRVEGGGLYSCYGSIQNNTIFGNSSNKGGGLSRCGGAIRNCIIWQNSAVEGMQLYASSTPSYSCIQDWISSGTGNISAYPQLVNPDSNDFHLLPDSPCINTGIYIPDLTEDFENDVRPQGSAYDIGADEFISDNSIPDTPRNIKPTQGATNISLTPTLRASSFSDSDKEDTHQVSQWHIWAFGTTWTVFSSTTSVNLSSITIPPRTLSDNITYSWCVRYQDDHGAWSQWSAPTEFTTEETGGVITVPGDYPTIQAAIDSAIYGDEIVISPNRYVENISFRGKNIILRSTDPTDPNVVASTIIDGNQAGSVVTFVGDETSSTILFGFTITNGTGSYKTLYRAPTEPPYGGGIFGFGHGTLATIKNNIIIDNSSKAGGGVAGCHGTIENNTISRNLTKGKFGSSGGGIYFCHGTIRNNLIMANTATGRPSSHWEGTGGGLANCDGTIQNNTIINNSADTGGGLLGCDGTIENNTISGNSCAPGHGGGLHQCHGTIRNNIISGNRAQGWGGGIYYSDASIQNNTICGNSASYGGGVSRDGKIQNCILWGNKCSRYGAQIYHASSTYSSVEGSYPGEGNINADPCFVHPGYWDANGLWVDGDYHLLETSPCIDTGDPNFIPEPNETDLDGHPRLLDGDENGTPIVDMGAYEYWPPLEVALKFTPKTLNCDSKGNLVKAHVTMPAEISPEDIDVNTPVVAYPMGIESQYIAIVGNSDGPVLLEIAFDRRSFCSSIADNGYLNVTVVGLLETGREFTAADSIRIITRQHRR